MHKEPISVNCERCGDAFEPYGAARFCKPCRPAARREATGERDGYNEPKPSKRDEQMERLYRYYEARPSIEINDRPDGTRLLVMSDTQIPFVDQPFLDAVMRFSRDWKPHDIIYAGDILDCYDQSDFDKRPNRMFSLPDEIDQATGIMARMKREAMPDTQLWWIDGNHEARFQRQLWKRSPELAFAVKDLPELLGLEQNAAGYVPYGKHVDYLGFTITHGNLVRKHSAYTAKAHFDEYKSSGMNGHTHRAGLFCHTDMHGRSRSWFEIGCVCRRDLEYVRGVANWQHAFLIGVVYRNALHPQLIQVIETDEGRGFFAAGHYYGINDGGTP